MPKPIILLLILLLALSACDSDEKLLPAETTAELTAAETEAPLTEASLVGESLILRGCDNPTLGGDLRSFHKGDKIYLFLPGWDGINSAVISSLDASGAVIDTVKIDLALGRLTLGGVDVKIMTSDLPALFLTLDEARGTFAEMEASRDKSAACYGEMALASDGELITAKDIRLKGRGNWTWLRDKKGYGIKLTEKLPLLGMEAARDWVLLANVADNTLMRNIVAYELARGIGLDFTPESASVELYIGGEYRGSYVLAEKTEVGSARVDIYDLEDELELLNPELGGAKLHEKSLECGARIRYARIDEPEDVTGGYLVEFELPDRFAAEPCGFVTKRGHHFVVKSPEYTGERGMTYLAELYQRIENAIFSRNGIDKDSGAHYSELIDLTSAARKYALEEVTKNFDANHSSQYTHKDRGEGKLVFGPVWDMDAAFGNTEATWESGGAWASNSGWWQALMRHEDFRREVSRILTEELLPLCDNMVASRIDELADYIEPSANMNFIRWRHLGVKPTESTYIATGKTYRETVEQLKKFISERCDWAAREIVK